MDKQIVMVPSKANSIATSILPNHNLQLAFDIENTSVERSANSLVFHFNDGGTITITDFFVTEQTELPDFILSDGTKVHSKEFLQSLNPDMDMSTAAGPSSASSSGAGEYADAAGDLVGGVSRLGDMESSQWSIEGMASDVEILSSTLPLSASADHVLPPVRPVDPEPPVKPIDPEPPVTTGAYQARAVLYNTTDSAATAVRFFLLDSDQKPIYLTSAADISISATSENSYFNLANLMIASDGSVMLNLSNEGLAAIQEALDLSGGDYTQALNLFDYITFTVNGYTYTMQVIINHDGTYTPADALEDGRELDGQTIPEWHNESHSDTAENIHEANRTTGDGNDVVWLDNALDAQSGKTLSINLMGGDDKIHLAQGMSAHGQGSSNTIDTGTGNDSVQVLGLGIYATSGASNTIIASTGKNTVGILGGLIAQDNSSNLIDAGRGESTISIDGGLEAYMNSSNTVISGANDDAIYGPQISASFNGKNTIDLGNGNNTINASILAVQTGTNTVTTGAGADTIIMDSGQGLKASSGGTNTIHAGSGENTITAYAVQANNGSNTIISEGGNDTITVTGKGIESLAGGSNTIDAGDGKNTVTVTGNVKASGENSINAIKAGTDSDRLTVSENIQATMKGKNTIDLGNGDNTIEVTKDVAANYGGENTITMGSGNDTITATDIYASSDSKNIINMGDGTDVISVPGSKHGGIYSTGNNSHTTITKGDGLLTINTDGISAGGSGSSFNILGEDGKSADIIVNSYFLAGTNSVININKNIDDFTINNAGRGRDLLLYAREGGKINLSAENITMTGTETAHVSGIRAQTGGENTLLVNDTLDIKLETSGRGSVSPQLTHAMSVTGYGVNSITGSEDAIVRMDIQAQYGGSEGGVSGMYAYNKTVSGSSAINTIKANDVEMLVNATAASAFGMYAVSGGEKFITHNTIESTDNHAITVTISVNTAGSSSLDKANAMHAENMGAVNKIIGHSTADTSDQINITGNLYSSRGANIIETGSGGDRVTIDGDMYAWARDGSTSPYGLNRISTQAGDDIVSVTGKFTVSGMSNVTGRNIIETGDGSDIVFIDGSIGSKNALHLQMGDNPDDYDTLVLTANSYTDFTARYGAWLSNGGLNGASVEHIHINGTNAEENSALLKYLQQYAPGGTDITYSSGGTMFLDNADLAELDIANFLELHEGTSTLDFSGGNANNIRLNDLLKDGNTVNGLKINGSSEDSVDFSNWQSDGTVQDGYVAYSHSGGSTVWVHESLITANNDAELQQMAMANTL